MKVRGGDAVYHCMSRAVAGELLFGDREKEILRRMLWQVADFCGVEVLTYCLMSNHFHILVRVPFASEVSDKELVRRYQVLYPKPTEHETATVKEIRNRLAAGGEEADALRLRLCARMGDVSEFMKTLKQRFTIWYNSSHKRYGTLWAERFKSVLVEGRGNPLQTMAAYIDLNPVRAGLVKDPKDYRFCGYGEAVAGRQLARRGIAHIWACSADGSDLGERGENEALRDHRAYIFGKYAGQAGLPEGERQRALALLAKGRLELPRATVLRCRVRYFTDGAVFGSIEFVRGYVGIWQRERQRRRPPRPQCLEGAEWGDLATLKGFRRPIFS